MGSETIPPCQESVVHITLDKPLEIPNCQFKLLRESSLVRSRAHEIHSRLEMPLNDRPVYKFNAQSVTYLPSFEGLVPQSYFKYLLSYGIKIKRASKRRFAGKLSKRAAQRAARRAAKRSKFSRWERVARKTPKKHRFGPGFRKGEVTQVAKDTCFVPGHNN